MADLDLRFIGTGNAFAPEGLCWNGFVVNGKYLFEAPPHSLQALNKARIDLEDLDAVVLSHHHGDHFLGLPFLLLQWKYARRKRPVRIVGPKRTRELATLIGETVYPDLMKTPYEIEWDERGGDERFNLGDLQLESFEMKHDERLSGTLGFNAVLEGRRFSYTGDSAWCPAVDEMAKHAEVLISECASLTDEVDVHMNLVRDMPNLRAAMQPDATLLMTHLGPGVDNGGLPRTIVAQDRKRYRF